MFFYEEAERVPFYALGPGIPAGRTVRERVSLVDVLPTLADLGGADVEFPVDGVSLAPLLRDEHAETGGAPVFSEYHGYLSPSDMYMIIKGDHKYCHYLQEPGELYNLAQDPAEEHNLVDDPACEAIRADLEAEIRQRVDIDRLADRIREYNLQRAAITGAMTASEAMQRLNQEYSAWYRSHFDSGWWDGGAYGARWEHHLYAKTGYPPGSQGANA
jgi:choline-sulfatase